MHSENKKLLWGVDLGGTKIEGAILDPLHPTHALHRLRVPTEASHGYDHIMGQIGKLILRLEQVSGLRRPACIGVGTPGVTSPQTGTIKNSNTLCLNGRSLVVDLSKTLGVQVILANDANCFALAEATLGAAVGYKTVFGIILGTGVGGGIVVDGRILTGNHGICGEWGHNPLRGEDAVCYCGRRGCVEMVCAGPSLERFYAGHSGRAIKMPQIVEYASGGETLAIATMERLRMKFSEALGAVINILDPDAIVIGGGVGNLDMLYTPETRDLISTNIFNHDFDAPLLKPVLGDSAGVFGAAMLAWGKINHLLID